MQLVGGIAAPEQGEQTANTYFSVEWNKTPLCLELRLPDGCRRAIPYSYFTEISFDADAGIEILTTQKRIKITGRNLAHLFDSLVTYRVRYIQADFGNDAQEDGLFVAEIIIDEL